MPTSSLAAATRAFVHTLLALARTYNLAPVGNRDSGDDALRKAYRRVLLKAHPDKGGDKAHVQRLQAAKELLDKARKETRQGSVKRHALKSSSKHTR